MFTDAVDVHEGVFDLALLADAIAILLGLEVGSDVGIRHRHLVLERIGCDRHDIELHLFVAALVLLRDIVVTDGHPGGRRVAKLFDDDRATHLIFELGCRERRVGIHLQHLPVALLADKVAVLLKRGNGQNPFAHFDVARGQLLTSGLGHHRFFVDQLLQDLLLDAELAQELFAHLCAVRLTIGRHLR